MKCFRCKCQTFVLHVNENHEKLCEGCIVGDITRNFSRWEFACRCGCGLDSIDERSVHRLQVVRDILQVRIDIRSGCRCKKHNYDVRGKPSSFHLVQENGKSWAIDWTIEDEEKLMEAGRLLSNWSGGFHQYSDFIHTDIGPKRRW